MLTANFIGEALAFCRELGFRGALLLGYIGKLVKITGGMLNTHSKYGDSRMEILAAHADATGLRPPRQADRLYPGATRTWPARDGGHPLLQGIRAARGNGKSPSAIEIDHGGIRL